MPAPEPNRSPDAEQDDEGALVLPDGLAAVFQSAGDCEGKLAALCRHFELKTISEPADLQLGMLCALRKGAELYLVEIGPLKDDRRSVELRLQFSARHAKPAPLSALVELGRNGSLHRLEPKAIEKPPQDPAPNPSKPEPETTLETASKAEGDSTNWAAQTIDLT